MNFALFLLILLPVTAAIAGAVWSGYFFLRRSKTQQIRGRLAGPVGNDTPAAYSVNILNEEQGTARHLRLKSWAMSQVESAGLDWSPSKVLLLCAACSLIGTFFGLRIGHVLPRAVALFGFVPTVLFAGLPFLYLARRRRTRLKQIEMQLPDALDFIARSMRVGNSFLMSLEMLVDESEEPLRGEFRRLTGEIRLGSPIAEPLKKLTDRAPLVDLRMFVSAVLLQRETGGNLGSLLTRISASIRDRFRVRGQVAAAASQAQLSAKVLSAMPFVVLGGILVLSPGYLKIMTDDPLGRKLLLAAAFGQLAGFLIMRKIVRIKV